MDASARLWLAQPTAREARSEAVFASTLQPSDTPTADTIASAISRAVQRLGTRLRRKDGAGIRGSPGCGGRADALGPPARRIALHAQTACTARRTGRPADQAPERLASTRRRHARPSPSSRRRS